MMRKSDEFKRLPKGGLTPNPSPSRRGEQEEAAEISPKRRRDRKKNNDVSTLGSEKQTGGTDAYPNSNPPSPVERGAGGEATQRVVGAASKAKVAFAREQRKHSTRAERQLWSALRHRQLGAKFRRQHPISDFVLDFYCAEAALAIEIDGPAHERQAEYDHWRDVRLRQMGIRVLRFAEELVNRDLDGVLQAIKKVLSSLTPNPSPSRRGEQEEATEISPKRRRDRKKNNDVSTLGSEKQTGGTDAYPNSNLPSPAGRGAGGEASANPGEQLAGGHVYNAAGANGGTEAHLSSIGTHYLANDLAFLTQRR